MALDVEKLLAEIGTDAPCGEDLSYDPEMMELERIAQGTPEQQVGETIVPAEEPNWREVRNKAMALCERTRSLAVLKYLVVSMLETDGLVGLAEALAVLRGTVERHWDTVWPQLDPEDDNDPLERMNILSFLSPPAAVYGDPIRFLQRLAQAGLCASKQLGRYSLRDVQIARGELAPAEDETAPDLATIEAAFRDTPVEDLDAIAGAAAACVAHLQAVDAMITEKVGADQAVNLDAAHKAMQEVVACISTMSGGLAGTAEAAPQGNAETGAEAHTAGPAGPALSGEIRSAEDVVRALDMISRFYQRTEPSSPVPLLLRRARRLARSNFTEIIQELTPDAWTQIEMISGPLNDESQGA